MVFNKVVGHRFFVNFLRYKYLLMELVKRDIKIKYRRSVLGIFWSFLQPLLTMIVFTIIFSTLFKGSIPNYPVYIISGKIMFDFFATGTTAAMGSITRNAGIIKKIYVPKYIYPLSVVLSNFVTFLMTLVVIVMVMVVTHVQFTVYILLMGLPIVLLFMLTLGVGLILATLAVFFRDITHLYGVFTLLLMYGSAIFYPASIVPPQFQIFLTYNPLYAIITLSRDSFLYGRMYDPSQLLFATVTSVFALGLGLILFYKYKDKFILYV